MHASERELGCGSGALPPHLHKGAGKGKQMMTDRADPARAEQLTILDRIPEGRCVFLGEAHDLLCVAVSNKVGLLMCSEYWPWSATLGPRLQNQAEETGR